MSHQWSRRNSHRASSRKRRRRRSVRSTSSFGGGLPEDENEILQMYGEDGELVGDPEDGEDQETLVERIRDQKDIMENVKFQPWPIGKKLQVLNLARSFIEKHEGRLSRGRGYQQKGRQLLKQLKRSWNNLENWITPWEMKIKRIESHFGSVVTSYFIFLRWLLWINLWLTVCQCCFVILPEMLVGADYGTTPRKTIPEEERFTAYDLKTIWDAEGVVRYSPLFYGYYGAEETIGSGYRLPLAYLMTTLVSFAYSFIVVLKKMASNARQSRMSNKDEQFTFSWKLYTDWDYMVGNPETATTKHASIVTTMKEAIVEEQEKKQEENKYLLIFLRILANVIIVILLATSTYVIYLFVERSRELELRKLKDKDYEAGFWAENELTIMMTMISTLFPNVLDLISLMEKYHPRTALRLQLARIFVLNLINLYTLFIALYNKQNDLKSTMLDVKSFTNSSLCTNGTNHSSSSSSIDISTATSAIPDSITITADPLNISLSPVTLAGTGEGTSSTAESVDAVIATCVFNTNHTLNQTTVDICWETTIGQEVFKLTVMDLIFTLGQIFIIDVFRSIFVKYCNNICCWDLQKKFPEYPDFKTAENLLHLINNQGVVWLGVFFSPGLALLNLLKLLLLMYVRCWTVIVCNVPQERIFRASRSNNFYFALLLVMLFLCMLPPLFAIVGIEPSPMCGPFSGLDKIYNILTNTIEEVMPAAVSSIMDYAASPGVILPTFMLLGMTIYYLIAIGRSLRDANNELRMMLEYERTEGRKKVYAMADAKHELEQPGGGKSPGLMRMTSAVTSVMKAAQMANALSGLKVESRHKQSSTSEAGQKVAPAVRPKPHVPVAVVHGKRSLKRSAAAVRNRAAALRQQPQQHGGTDRQTLTGTNGHMQVTASTSLDTPDASSNDDDEVFNSSHSSSRSSHGSPGQQDDPAAIVDDTGHLRPVSEDDVYLDLDSESEEEVAEEEEEEERFDEESQGRIEDDEDLSAPPLAPSPEQAARVRQAATRPPTRSKASRPSRKIQPAEIPKITVVDFGEEDTGTEDRCDDITTEGHVEPTVVVENEQTGNRPKHRDNKSLIAHGQRGDRTKQRAKQSTKSGQQPTSVATNGDRTGNDAVRARRTGTVESNVDGSHGPRSNDSRGNSSNGNDQKESEDVSSSGAKKTLGKASKSKFSSILARFQKMDGSG